MGREVIRELVDKTPRVVPEQGLGWQVYYAFFVREGFTDAARAEAENYPSRLLTLTRMEPDLRAR